ncbi:MAG: methionine--tRNA ligase [archaeon]|nr:methionine--tRNA ligase [archaeon]
MKKFYISTAIDYPSARFHLGHAYEKVVTDTLARWKRLNGYEVYFSTGTDCHGLKIQRAAEKAGKDPQVFVDEISDMFRDLCKELNISYTDFIMTTEERHKKVVKQILNKLKEKGDIYEGEYEGIYCQDCETFYTEKDLVDGFCPVHKTKIERVKEKSYFFRMSKYQKQLVEHIKKGDDSVWPEKKRAELLNRLKEPLRDLSISREQVSWGIPLPFDENLTTTVWVDALTNYITVLDYPNEKFKEFWPGTHVIGSDIIWHHSVIWKTMLLALGISLPRVIVHGFINLDGEKLSKARGIIIDPIELAEKYSADSLRYFLLREISFGQDGNFSEKSLIERHNNELANELGNLLQRTLSLAEQKLGGVVPNAKVDQRLSKPFDKEKISHYMDKLEPHNALQQIFFFISECNKFINATEPWKLEGKEVEGVLYSLLDSLRIISILLAPFVPETSEKISKQLNISLGNWEDVKFNLLKPGIKLGEKQILFNKVQKIEKKEEKIEKAREISVTVDPKLKKLGLKLVCAVIENVKVKNKHEGLEKIKKETVKSIDLDSVEEQKVIQGYLDLYKEIGVKQDYHAVKNLVDLAKKSGNIPQINTVVDSYNLVSIEKGLIVGAHDLEKISGNVRVTFAKGDELYIPLGTKEKMKLDSKEYVFKDDAVVLCRLDVKQGEHTKVTNETKNVFLYVQGNKNTSQEYIEKAMKQILANIEKYCGGKIKVLNVN